MPEQASQRALAVTASPIEAPFQTEIWPFGQGGLNLKDQHDKIPVGEFAQLTNLVHTQDRGLTLRPTLVQVATGGTLHHSVRRLHNPRTSDTRFWGTDTEVRVGLTGALSQVDTGYSGDPLTLLPHRPQLAAEPWMFVADRSRMRKMTAGGTVMPIGLAAPGSAAVVTPGTFYSTPVCAFNNTDGTQANTWTATAGFDRSNPAIPSGQPLVLDAFGLVGSSVAFRAFPGSAQTPYNSWWGHALSLDLSLLSVSDPLGFPAIDASDQDVFHLYMQMSHPQFTEEIRIYFVCSNDFNPTQLPGLTGSTGNNDFYVKGFRQHDFAQAIQGQQALVDAAETARIRALRNQSLADRGSAFKTTENTNGAIAANQDPAVSQTIQANSGSGEWIQYGIVDVPWRRGDFQRVGQTPGADWSTITGIIVYVSATNQAAPGLPSPIEFHLNDLYLFGGSGPDDMEPGSQPYDWRYTHYDPRTGAESNPSPEMAAANFLDLIRREGKVQVVAYGDGNIRQRIYRRGSSLIADWYFVGQTTGDGTLFTDTLTDDAISTAGTVNLDHYQPVATIDTNGNTVLAQPVASLFGPANGILFACGDPYRPGHLYWAIPDEPDHWPVENSFEVCSPSEELMAGLMLGAQPFVFSRERLYAIYPNLTDTTEITVSTTGCRRGLVSRWGWTIAMGNIFAVAKDAIFATIGGAEEVISTQVINLFRGKTWNGYSPVDFSAPTAIRLSTFEDQLFFTYQGLDGQRHTLCYSLLFKYWAAYEYAGTTIQYVLPDEDTGIATLLAGGRSGKAYTLDPAGTADDGVAVPCTVRTGDWDLGRPREDKLLGDQILDADTDGVQLTLTNRLNNGDVVNGTNAITAAAGRTRFTIDGFGPVPQRARNISTDISWSSATGRPILYFLGQSLIPEPDQTNNRVTQWDDLGHPDESYVTGITLDCDTGNAVRTVLAEGDFDGVTFLIATLAVQANGRHKLKFSWPAVQAHKVRLRPEDDCAPWILYRADWISVPEPPRIAGWDIHFEADGDQYYTGLDLYCDTEGLEKQIQIKVDEQILTNPYTGEALWRVTATGRRWIHLTLPWGRGHVFHFTALDANPGLLYKHKWFVAPEPSEQANWNQNFSIEGTLADKWFKAALFEVDTFNQTKSVTIEIDGVVKETLPVKTDGRKVVHLAFTQQYLGRVLRIYPVDGNPSRPYSILPIFDVEPYQLTRWETQETDHDLHGFQVPLEGQITIKSTKEVVLTISTYLNQLGTIVTDQYVIPPTGGIKDKRYVPFNARKGVLFKYLFTSTEAFWLYREESSVYVQPWGGTPGPLMTAVPTQVVRPFGNDDADRTRSMVNPIDAAQRSGGGSL